jgi:hypothetical protein
MRVHATQRVEQESHPPPAAARPTPGPIRIEAIDAGQS